MEVPPSQGLEEKVGSHPASSARPEPTVEHPQHLCLDAGYDYESIYGDLYERGYEPHVRLNPHHHAWYWHALEQQPTPQEPPSALEATKVPRRWVIERLFPWLNRWRRLLVRWEKLAHTYDAFLRLACALICFQFCRNEDECSRKEFFS